jgi:hypothetical protein
VRWGCQAMVQKKSLMAGLRNEGKSVGGWAFFHDRRYPMSNVFSDSFLQKTLIGFGLWCGLFFIPTAVHSATTNFATLQWAANSESDLAGYKVYQGTTAGSYGPSIDVKNFTTYTVSNLQAGLTYSFAITAYDLSGNESYPSDEVSIYIADSSPDLTPPALSLPSPTKGTTRSGLATKQENFSLTKDLKQTAPPAEPRPSPTTVTLSQQGFTATGNAVIAQPTVIILSRGLKGDQAQPILERNIQVLEGGKPSLRRTIP